MTTSLSSNPINSSMQPINIVSYQRWYIDRMLPSVLLVSLSNELLGAVEAVRACFMQYRLRTPLEKIEEQRLDWSDELGLAMPEPREAEDWNLSDQDLFSICANSTHAPCEIGALYADISMVREHGDPGLFDLRHGSLATQLMCSLNELIEQLTQLGIYDSQGRLVYAYHSTFNSHWVLTKLPSL